MTQIDTWAALAASVASFAVGMRARMLRPKQSAWTGAPMSVWGGLSALALCLGMAAMTLWFGAHATAREAMIYSVLAASSVAMLWNLNRTGRAKAVRQQEIRDEIATVWDASGPPAPGYHLNAPRRDAWRGRGQ